MILDFSDLLGNDSAKSDLLNALEKGELSSTLLFHGIEGVGKKLFAKVLAHHILGGKFHQIEEENHPDLHVYYPEGKSYMHSIQSMRTLVSEMYKPPFTAKEKVFIINEAEKMLPSSSNLLLKTFEEPSLDSTIILISSHPDALMPTILSRCIQIRFHGIEEALIVKYLEEKYDQPRPFAEHVARLSEGSLGKAIQMASDAEFVKKRNRFMELFTSKTYWEFQKALQDLEKSFDQEEDKYHEQVDELISQILMWFRDLRLLRERQDSKYLYFPELKSMEFQGDIPSLEEVEDKLTTLKTAMQRNMKLSTCLEWFSLELGLF